MTTPNSIVMANPDGTYTLTSTVDPVRTRKNGSWVPIDTTLQRNSDGTLSPAATELDIAFSGGGTGPAIRVTSGSSSLAFSWPSPLPPPVVSGDTATYASVLPGVDLKLTAKADSYGEVLVVHSALAASNPSLTNLQLTATATGLDLTTTAEGGLSATDHSGAEIFTGPAPSMWDSHTDSHVGPAPTFSDSGSGYVTPLNLSMPTADGVGGSASTTETLTVPQAALTGAGVVYPVFIDPPLAISHKQHFAVVFNNGWHYYDDTSNDMKVGYCGWTGCNGIGTGRTYFSFDTSVITGQATTAHIYSAVVSAYEIHNAGDCTSEPVNLWSTNAAINSSTVWGGPAAASLQQVSSNRGDTCSTSPPGYISFDNANVVNTVQNAANQDLTTLTYGLLAPNESDAYQWKRFDSSGTPGAPTTSSAKIDITYDFAPSAPTGLSVSNTITCSGKPTYVTDTTPTLQAKAHDNNPSPGNVDLWFELWRNGGSAKQWYNPTAVSAPSDTPGSWTTNSSNTNNSSPLTDGDWAFRVQASTADQYSGYSSWYGFTVDKTPPANPPVMTSSDYPYGYWGAPTGTGGTFSLWDNGTSAAGFAYSFDNPGQETAPLATDCNYNQPAKHWAQDVFGTAQITAPSNLSVGYHRLYVRTFDDAHNMSPESAPYVFYVAPNFGASEGPTRIEAEDGNHFSYSEGSGQNFPLQAVLNLSRYYNFSLGDHSSITYDPPAQYGYYREFVLGALANFQTAGTVPLYRCMIGNDQFSSTSSTCEGQTSLGLLGYIYSSPQTAPPTVPLYRCRAGTEHFDSNLSNCEGQIVEGLLGYLLSVPGIPMSNFAGISAATNAVGQSYTAQFTTPLDGYYALGAGMLTGPTNGQVSFSLDGSPLSAAVIGSSSGGDTYSATPWIRYVVLGGVHLAASPTTHTLTITVTGKNASSSGYNSGFDYLTLVPISVRYPNIQAAFNNNGIAVDATTSANLGPSNAGTGLSEMALQAQGLGYGQTKTIDGIDFTMPIPNADGTDNVISSRQTIDMKTGTGTYATPGYSGGTQVATPSVDLLVASSCAAAGTPTGPPIEMSMEFHDNANGTGSIYTNDVMTDAIPDWTTSTIPAADTQVTLAATLDHYDSGPNPVSQPVYLYHVKIPINSLYQGLPLTAVTLPDLHSDFSSNNCTTANLHVLALSTS